MSWIAAGIIGGAAVLGSMGQYGEDKQQAKYARRMQEYRNRMANIANAINQNAITQNTTLTIQQSAKKAVFMRKDELSTLGQSAVAASASGVRGKSVEAVTTDIERSAGLLEKQRADDLDAYFMQADQQRLGSAMSAVMNQDLSYIPKVNFSGYMFDAIGGAGSAYMGGASQ